MEKLMFTLVLFAVVLFTNSRKSGPQKNIITQYQFRFISIEAINLTEFDSTADLPELVGQLLDTDLTNQFFGDNFVDQWFGGDVSGQSINDTLVIQGVNDTSLNQLWNGASLVQRLNDTLKGQLSDEDLKSSDFKRLKKVKETYHESKQYQIIYPVTLQNMFTTLREFQTDHCLLLIDNWQGVEIKQTSAMPYILRTLDLALYHRIFMMKHYDYLISEEAYDAFDIWDTMLLPKKFIFHHTNFSKLDLETNQYHNCPSSKFYFPLIPDKDHNVFCVDLNHEMFASSSKPWQCEIQVNLFMPERLLKVQKFPGLFKYNSGFKFLPSLRPKLYIFLDFNSAEEQDSDTLLIWKSNPQGGYSSQNHAHISGQVVCTASQIINSFHFSCNILTISYIDYCFECPTLLSSTLLNSFSYRQIALIDRDRVNDLYAGMFYCDRVVQKQFSLSEQIPKFERNEPEAIINPLKYLHKIKRKYTDNIQILAFAYTSVLKHLLGNVTSKPLFTYNIIRYGYIDETLYDNLNVALSIENKFGSLRFVSCGSRGLQKLQLEQFLSVFETNIWKWLLAFAILLLVSMNLLQGSICSLNVLSKITCLIKVLLEQGDPFPGRFVKCQPFRFLIWGTLIGGLVLSNAFKSTNVYNIVMPKQLLKFSTIDELLEHGYSVYSKLIDIHYFMFYLGLGLLPTKALYYWDVNDETNHLDVDDCLGNNLFLGRTEIQFYVSLTRNAPKKLIEKEQSSLLLVKNVSKPHLGLHDIIVEPFKILTPLFQVGLIDIESAKRSAEAFDIWTKQDKFIVDDLNKCNKSAWILPNYQAQQLTRLLHQSGKHSDVGVNEYFKTRFNFIFDGPLSSVLLQRASMVSSSGLLKWWSDLINRTDLIRHQENMPPVKPTLSGNIQTLFYMLLAGLIVAQTVLVFELHEYILKKLKTVVCLCGFALLLTVTKLKIFVNICQLKIYFSYYKTQRHKINTVRMN